jgi:4-hydroxy-tetrahydrodipicolinate synthase
MRTRWTGCGTALVTPFTSSGAVDEAAVRRLARRQVDAGIHFVVPCGTTGETPTLSAAERRRIVELVVDEVGDKVPVLAGAGGYNTHEVIEAVEAMTRAGAHGILSVTPYYNKPTQEGLYQHYRAIAESTDLPIVVYNVPGRTGCNVEAATLVRLSSIKNIVGVKEASGNVSQIIDICTRVPAEFIVLSGDDGITLPIMAVGGKGLISVASTEAPGDMARLVEACERNDWDEARALNKRLLPLMTVNFIESSPGPVKAAMARMGLIEEVYRLPMVSPREESKKRIEQVLVDLQLIAPAEARHA